MASFAAAHMNKQQLEQDMNNTQASKKDGQPSFIPGVALELENGTHVEGGFKESLGKKKDVVQRPNNNTTSEAGKRENLLKRKKETEEKGKTRVAFLEKAPKKTVHLNKGIVSWVMDKKDIGKTAVTNQGDASSNRSAWAAGLEAEIEGAEAESHDLGLKELEATKTNLVENLFGVQDGDTSVNWNDLESGEEELPSWVNTINTYGSNEGTIGDILREDKELEEDDGGIKI